MTKATSNTDQGPNSDAGAAASSLDYTGERMVPEHAAARTYWEHIHRYRFASRYAQGKRVLDVACGEGYGAAALACAGAAQVIGVDISEETCAHARAKYGIDARAGGAEALPLENGSIDLVVSFETLEHLEQPERFLDECARVLASEGVLIISTPNRPVYRQDVANPFHHREFDRREFLDLIRPRFRDIQLYSQFPWKAPFWTLRSFAAERSPWLRIKGYWRFSSWICPALRNQIPDDVRANPIQAISSREETLLSRFVNPYRVREPSWKEQPWYWIAVAQRASMP